MDPITLAVGAYLFTLVAGWFLRNVVAEVVAALRGDTSPTVTRRRDQAKLAADTGVPTIGQALSRRVARRIENPPPRLWAVGLRNLTDKLWADALIEVHVRHRAAFERRMDAYRRPAPRPARNRATPSDRHDEEPAVDVWPCRGQCGTHIDECDAWCSDCTERLGVCPCGAAAMEDAGPEQIRHDYPQAWVPLRCPACDHEGSRDIEAGPDIDPYLSAFRHRFTETCTCGVPDSSPDPGPVIDPPAALSQGGEPQREAPPMSETHTISADVRDPRTALAFAAQCRGFAIAGATELDTFTGVIRQMGLGEEPIRSVNVLADAVRNYAASTERSVEEYAQQIIIQRELFEDDAIRESVRGYLRMEGSDAGAPAEYDGATRSLCAADVQHPGQAASFMATFADAFGDLRTSADTVRGLHESVHGVGGDPVIFLAEQRDLMGVVADQAAACAGEFYRQVAKMQDTVGAHAALHGTQAGGWLDPVAS